MFDFAPPASRVQRALRQTLRTSFVVLCLTALPVHAELATIVVGQVVDQHGSDIESSRDYVVGAKLYFDYTNANGGIGGLRIKQVVRDSGGDPAEAMRQTRELIEKGSADVLFGYVGEAAIRAVSDSDLLQKNGIALVSPLTGLQNGNEVAAHNVFVTRASYSAELRKIVEHFKTISVRRFAVVGTRADLATQLVPDLRNALKDSGSELVADIIATDPNAMPAVLRRLEAAGPQVVIVIGDAVDLGFFARLMADRKVGLPVVGLSLANHRVVVQIAGSANAFGILISQVVPNPARSDTPVTREHLAFMKRYLDEPPSHLTLEGFMAAKALVEILKGAALHGRPDRQAILHALRTVPLHDVGGVTLDYLGTGIGAASSIELTMVRSDGTLLQ